MLRSVASRGGINVLVVGGTANHVHMLLAVPATRALADVMRELKANSSQRMHPPVAQVRVAGRLRSD